MMGVTISDQITFTRFFFNECLKVMELKAHDYAPKPIAISEAWWTAAETLTTPELSIYNAMRKHWGAVQTAISAGRPLEAETLHNHLTDIANYAVMMDFIITYRKEFLRAIEDWLMANPCDGQPHLYPCDHCTMIAWLHPIDP
jgi:hypothetical protein